MGERGILFPQGRLAWARQLGGMVDAGLLRRAARQRRRRDRRVQDVASRGHVAVRPASQQMAQPDLVTSFQRGHVAVLAVPGAPVPAGAPVPEDRAAKPGPGGPVITSVPPVGMSRPAPPPGSSVSARPAIPTVTRANEPIPSDFPEQSPAGPAPKNGVQPGPGGGGDAPALGPTPTPRPPGPGVG